MERMNLDPKQRHLDVKGMRVETRKKNLDSMRMNLDTRKRNPGKGTTAVMQEMETRSGWPWSIPAEQAEAGHRWNCPRPTQERTLIIIFIKGRQKQECDWRTGSHKVGRVPLLRGKMPNPQQRSTPLPRGEREATSRVMSEREEKRVNMERRWNINTWERERKGGSVEKTEIINMERERKGGSIEKTKIINTQERKAKKGEREVMWEREGKRRGTWERKSRRRVATVEVMPERKDPRRDRREREGERGPM